MKLRYKSNDLHKSLLHELCWDFSGPVLFQYVWWVLKSAQERKIDRLYFMARDGYLLLKIAERFCKKFSLPIELRYLYCSRTSLRMPSYHLLGTEAYDLLLLGGYRVTLKSLLERAGLNKHERVRVYIDCDFSDVDETKLISRYELDAIQPLFRNSPVLRELIMEKSRHAYADAIGYLKQEGLADVNQIALVDSGWTGSMQRSLRQLLQSCGCAASITGFYFGMYSRPKASRDGTYLTWYFDHRGRTLDKIQFCNNLFECLLSAPHGMTVGYGRQKNRFTPVFSAAPTETEKRKIYAHMQGVLEYTEERLAQIEFQFFQAKLCREDTRRRVGRYMARPTQEEAHFHGQNRFCDDVTESYHLALAGEDQVPSLNGYLFVPRVLRRLGLLYSPQQPQLLWPYGTIAFLPAWKRPWYRWNVYLWEWIRYARD